MILEDFVMLGKTVPEENADGRVFVCSAGYSPELRELVRIYPLARYGTPKRWSVNKVRLERNPKDNRHESWRLDGDRSADSHDQINNLFEPVGRYTNADLPKVFSKVTVESIAEANDRRLSLAVIHPDQTELHFEHNPESPDSPMLRLFAVNDAPRLGAKRFAYMPRLRFSDPAGSHNLMLRDWGCFEFMRKFGNDRRHELAQGLHLTEQSSLLIGNLNNTRKAWIIISVLNGIRTAQPSLFAETARR